MARHVFYSFHYQPDSHRASQVREMNTFEGQEVLGSNDWEKVKRAGDGAVFRWIEDQMQGKSCTVVLIGSGTANRKYINYEIGHAWAKGKGLLGIDIHGLKNLARETSSAGANPFDFVTAGGYRLSNRGVVRHTSPYSDSRDIYAHIRDNLATWVDEAVEAAKSR